MRKHAPGSCSGHCATRESVAKLLQFLLQAATVLRRQLSHCQKCLRSLVDAPGIAVPSLADQSQTAVEFAPNQNGELPICFSAKTLQ